MATYITVFLFELLSAYILWFVLKEVLKITKFYRIAIICLIVSLLIGYIASYRIIGYQVTLDYLTKINNQKIEETGQGITLQQENEYKKELFNNEEFQKLLINSSIKISLIPFILIIFIMIFFVEKAKKNLPPSSAEPSNPAKRD